jgi:hypothetical protein
MAAVAIVLPFGSMNSIHALLGMGELPQMPIIGYLTRSISCLYALCGAGTLVIAQDPVRYRPVITFWGVAHVIGGGILLAIDVSVDMPWFWTLAEGPSLIVVGIVTLWLCRGMNSQD